MNKIKIILLNGSAVVAGLLMALLVLEGAMRLLPISDIPNQHPVNEEDPIAHFPPNRDTTFSKGWNFPIVTNKHINNYGYFSDFDYQKRSPGSSPLLAIIGDSYVEALQVENNESMHDLLYTRLDGKGRVYGLGTSGSPLSQYLAFAEFARSEFDPDAMAFVIVGNDFDESLLKYKWAENLHYFSTGSGGIPELTRIDFAPSNSFVKNIIVKSALVRYIFQTVGVDWRRIIAIFDSDIAPQHSQFVGNTSADISEDRVKDSKYAVDTFLSMLPVKSGLSAKNILFIVDGMRPNLYTDDGMEIARGSYFDLMRNYFIGQATVLGYEVIDMQPLFIEHFLEGNKRFEFPMDAHWNALGHRVVADVIEKSAVYQRIF